MVTAVTLGEGGTPLLDLGDRFTPGTRVWVKAEYLNPTGSFKDRIAAVAATLARQRGLRGLLGTSSGNGGAAAAAYAARAGLQLVVLALPSTPAGKLAQIQATGARLHFVEGLGTDAEATVRTARMVADNAEALGYLPFLTGADYCPDIMTGARAIATELAAGPADVAVYAPVGGGGLLASIWRGFTDLGLVRRLVGVQPAGCATIADALAGGPGRVETATTAVSGLQVATLFDHDAPRAVTGSGGHLRSVTDEEIVHARAELARAGILVELAGATALAGVLADHRDGVLRAGDEVVAVATGAGWKDPAGLAALQPVPADPPRELDELIGALR